MNWRESHRADRRALPIANRHYSRQKVGSPQFVKPGRCVVLLTRDESALWVTSWPFAEYVKHEWAGAWECSTFRNEGDLLGSKLITQAVAITRAVYGEPPPLGMITFIDPRIVPGFVVRTKEGPEIRWGYSFWQAGFKFCGWTKGMLYAMQMLPDEMPDAAEPYRAQRSLIEAVA